MPREQVLLRGLVLARHMSGSAGPDRNPYDYTKCP